VAWFGFRTESEWAERGGVLPGARSAGLAVVRVEEAAAGIRGGAVVSEAKVREIKVERKLRFVTEAPRVSVSARDRPLH
jgi:hypothetical protein